MKITAVKTAVVEANYDYTYVRIFTDRDEFGTGESFFSPGLTAIIKDLAPVLVGKDPRHVDRRTRELRRAASAEALRWRRSMYPISARIRWMSKVGVSLGSKYALDKTRANSSRGRSPATSSNRAIQYLMNGMRKSGTPVSNACGMP